MANWQERIRQLREAEKQAEMQRQKESVSWQERARTQRQEKETNIQLTFEILEKLGVEERLREFKKDVWKKGEIEWFDKHVIVEPGSSVRMRGVRVKGVSLTYAYDDPGERRQGVVEQKRRLVLEEPTFTDYGGGEHHRATRTGTKFTLFGKENIWGPVYYVEKKSTYINIYAQHDPGTWGHPGDWATLHVKDGSLGPRDGDLTTLGGASFPLSLDPNEVNLTAAAEFLDQSLQEILEKRYKSRNLPDDIDRRIQEKMSQIPLSQLRYK